ncbi:PREDICTED: uncharacterized protein LOC105461043, partial [Wasmannia auropunctata]|uniref:uncharacterized protein LOC105461043 n=1 Tax=Wasmannia auropunctata TaxID=64793 RepID=UPI0005F042EF
MFDQKMFAALFAFVLLTAYAAEELPSYIRVCGLKDPKYNECILHSIMIAKDQACLGMSEFDISPVEPITIDKMVIFNTDNLKLNLEDLKIKGFCNLEVKSVNISPDKLHFDIDVTLKNIDADSKFDFDIRLLVSLANKGMIKFST